MFKASLNYKYHSYELQSLSFLVETKCPKVFNVNEFLLIFSCFDLDETLRKDFQHTIRKH